MDCRSNLRAYLVILGGVLVHLSLGTIYTLGNMIPYMVSYIRVHSNARELRNTGAIWIQSAALTGQAVGMAISGGLQLKFSTRVTTVIGGCVMSAGVALSYFSIDVSFWLLLFTYGFLFGVGLGIAYTPPFNCAMKWLPEKKGLVTGLVMVGFGGGAFVFNQIQTVFINPDNLIPDEAFTVGSNEKYFTNAEVLGRVPTCFLILAGCYTALQITGIILLADPPKDTTADERLSEGVHDIHSPKLYSDEIGETSNEQLSKTEQTESHDMAKNQQQKISQKTPSDNDTKDTSYGEASKIDVNTDKRQIDSLKSSQKNTGRGIDNLGLEPEHNCRAAGETIHMHVVGDNNDDLEENVKQIHKTPKLEQKQYSVLEMAKTKNFWILYVTLLLNGQGTILISSMYKAFGQTFVKDDHLLAFVGSFSAVFNSAGRPIWGLLTDILTYKVAMMFLCSCMCVLLFTMELTQLGGQEMFFVWICAFYFSLCGNYSMMPATVSRTFGSERVGINYSVVFTSQIITSFVSALLASQLQDAIGWFGLFQVTGGLIFISLLLTGVFDGRNPDGTPV